jgi:RNA polymerase sigma factor (sigma-70 family)
VTRPPDPQPYNAAMALPARAAPRGPVADDMADVPDAPDDGRLLDEYVARRSHDAFAHLVRRHVRFVYGCALRRTRDAQMADDVTQTVFTLLAKKASSARRRPLPGWLFAVTRRAAANELRAAARRKRHEQRAARPEATAIEKGPRDLELACRLDDALARLTRPDREAVLLRYFQGLDAAAVATATGVSEPAARRRLARAVARLRRFMLAGGAALGGAPLASAWTPPQAPPALAERVTSAAMSPSPARLAAARAVARAMWRPGGKAIAATLGASLLVAGAGFAVRESLRAHGAERADAVLAPPRPRRPNLKLTLAWNGQAYTVPLPPTFPDELRDTPAYRQWEAARDARTLEWTSRDGRKYVCHAEVRDVGGRKTALFSRVQLLRADGTLGAETINDERGEPRQWDLYATDGKTRQVSLTHCPPGTPGGPFVETVRLSEPDGSSREYHADRDGIVYEEWLLDANGRRLRVLNRRLSQR